MIPESERDTAAWMPIRQATRILGVTPNALKKRATESRTIRGLKPGSDGNPSGQWVFAWEDIARLAADRGADCPPVPSNTGDNVRAPASDAAARLNELDNEVRHLRARNDDLLAGYEMEQNAAHIARSDAHAAQVDALTIRAETAERQLEEARTEIGRLRKVIAQLVADE